VHYPGIYQLRVAVVGIDDHVVRYACGLFDGPKCVGLAEAAGSCRATDADGKPVDLAAALRPFRLRE
jgi:acyl-CoA thioester hydrolase